MQGLAQQVTALRPEALVNSDATVGEMAWMWGKDRADQGSTWRRRLWCEGGHLAGWGWIFLPYQAMRSDGQLLEITTTTLTWQVHPDTRRLLDDILDWYDTEIPHADRQVTVRAADDDALRRLAAHGYRLDEQAAGNARLLDPVQPPGPARPAGAHATSGIQLPDRRAGLARGRGAGAPGRLASLDLHRPRHAGGPGDLALPPGPPRPSAGARRHPGRNDDHIWLDERNEDRRVRAGRYVPGLPKAGHDPRHAQVRHAAGRPRQAPPRCSSPAWAPRRIKPRGPCTTTPVFTRSPAKSRT